MAPPQSPVKKKNPEPSLSSSNISIVQNSNKFEMSDVLKQMKTISEVRL